MNKFVTFCSLLMGGALLLCSWLYPESTIMWFADSSWQAVMWRTGLMFLLGLLLIAEVYADNTYVRRVIGMFSLVLLYGAVRFALDHPVYMFDFLFMLNASVCFGLVALQRVTELRELPEAPVRLPLRAAAPTMFERLHKLQPHKQALTPVTYIRDSSADDHRLVVGMGGPRSLA